MALLILMDEFHLTVRVPRRLAVSVQASIRRTLDAARFRRDLGPAVREVFRRYPELAYAHVTVTR